MVSGTISLFCSKCFSPFLHSTGSLSVSREYLALPDGPGRFTQNSSCSALLRIPLGFAWLRIRSCHALWLYFPEHSIKHIKAFGLIRFRSPLLTESLRFLFLRVLRCFSSPGLLCLRSDRPSTCRVAPFGYLRINSCVPIPVAFRSLPRPSSPLKA